ncbi:MAG TPA: hypothetical protein VN520_20465, partial [Streptomyces sp.]|nr:hypothetical protein [Streptomyces sp.]
GQDSGGAPDREGAGPDSGTTGGTQDGTDGREAPGRSPGEVYKESVRACRAYREDALSREAERRLLDLADGERDLDRFCDRLLGPDGRTGGSGSGEEGQGDGRDDGGSDGKNGGGSDGKNGDGSGGGKGSLPSIVFRTQAAESTQGDAPQGGAPQGGAAPRPTAGPTAGSLSALSSALR